MIWIPQPECVAGQLYRVRARNFRIGVWTGEGFLGIRNKWGSEFLDTEYHWDSNGTVRPLEALPETVPDGIAIEGRNPDLFRWLKAMRDKYEATK